MFDFCQPALFSLYSFFGIFPSPSSILEYPTQFQLTMNSKGILKGVLLVSYLGYLRYGQPSYIILHTLHTFAILKKQWSLLTT